MNRRQVSQALRAAKPVHAERYGVTRLVLFGSSARDGACVDSDMDIVVGFYEPSGLARRFSVRSYLRDELGCVVDLVTEKAVRQDLNFYIEREAVNIRNSICRFRSKLCTGINILPDVC